MELIDPTPNIEASWKGFGRPRFVTGPWGQGSVSVYLYNTINLYETYQGLWPSVT